MPGKKKKNLHRIPHSGVSDCAVCASVTVTGLCARWAKAAISCRVGDMKAVRFLRRWYLHTNAPGCLHPIMGEKLPPQNKKSPLSAVDCIRWNPLRREKWAGRGKKTKQNKKKPHSLPPILPGARGSPGSAWVSPTTELCLDRNQCSSHRIGIQ